MVEWTTEWSHGCRWQMEHGSDCCQAHVQQLLVVELYLAMVQLVSESFWRAICMVNVHAFLVEYVMEDSYH